MEWKEVLVWNFIYVIPMDNVNHFAVLLDNLVMGLNVAIVSRVKYVGGMESVDLV